MSRILAGLAAPHSCCPIEGEALVEQVERPNPDKSQALMGFHNQHCIAVAETCPSPKRDKL